MERFKIEQLIINIFLPIFYDEKMNEKGSGWAAGKCIKEGKMRDGPPVVYLILSNISRIYV
jgi:hypothetical protein